MPKSPASLVLLVGSSLLFGCAATPPAQSAEPPAHTTETEAPPAVATLTPSPKEQLSPEEIQAVVRAAFDDLRACYEQGLGRNPTLTGRVTVRIVIRGSGQVGEVEVVRAPTEDGAKPTDLPDEQAIDCMVAVWKTLEFPAFASGEVTVVYPIAFASENEPDEAE